MIFTPGQLYTVSLDHDYVDDEWWFTLKNLSSTIKNLSYPLPEEYVDCPPGFIMALGALSRYPRFIQFFDTISETHIFIFAEDVQQYTFRELRKTKYGTI